MYINFNELPDTSRVWVYQSNREFTTAELAKITEKLKSFVNSWKRHGEDLKASFRIAYNQFIILAVDESYNNVSGCSIDASVNSIKQLEAEFGID